MFYVEYLIVLCIFSYAHSDGDVSSDLLSVWLYDDLQQAEPIDVLTTNLSELNIDSTKTWVFLCHGWDDDGNSTWYPPLIQSYLAKNYIVFAADWAAYASSPYFSEAAPDTNPVAIIFANLIINLRTTLNMSLDKLHCVGHSLGAHVCGYIGQQVINTTSEKIGRITGLDPAGLDFNLASDYHRLSEDDGKFVDVIHTMAGVAGIIESVGHVDFWPNGGALQLVSCLNSNDIGCSHNIAPTYFTESVNSNNFIATKCSLYLFYTLGFCRGHERAIMGENVNTSQRGNFYLNTNPTPPYAQGVTIFT